MDIQQQRDQQAEDIRRDTERRNRETIQKMGQEQQMREALDKQSRSTPPTSQVPSHKGQQSNGKVVRGWLGVAIQELIPELASQFGVTETKGVLVSDVTEESPAKKAGFERKDVIVEYDGKPMDSPTHLRNAVAQTPIGRKVSIKLIRDKKHKTIELAIAEQPKSMSAAGQEENGESTQLEASYECTRSSDPIDDKVFHDRAVAQTFGRPVLPLLTVRNWHQYVFTKSGNVQDLYGKESQDIETKQIVKNQLIERRDGQYTIVQKILTMHFKDGSEEKHIFEIPHGTELIHEQPMNIRIDGKELKLRSAGYASCPD